MTSPTHFHLNAYGSRDIEGYRPVDDGQSARNNRSAIQSSEDNKRPSGLPTVLNFAQSSKDNTELSDLSQRVQTAHPPLFIPRFDSLRKTCIEQTQRELRTIESELEHHVNSNPASRSEKVATAVRLLQQLDQATENAVSQFEKEDPDYATQRGLTVVHFLAEGNSIHNGQWMMISRNWGQQSKNILETSSKLLSPYHQQHIKDFVSRSGTSCRFWFQRSKRASEQQWGSLKYHLDGSLSRHTGWIFWWKFVLLFAIAALVCFYGVGIIATNSTFSPIFVRYFFWVAIFWSLISSLLLSWVVIAFGSSTRDSVGAFLSAIAIWLVIIQIGQTRLSGQNALAAASNSTNPQS